MNIILLTLEKTPFIFFILSRIPKIHVYPCMMAHSSTTPTVTSKTNSNISNRSRELTPRTAISLAAITTLVTASYTLASLSVFPKHPHLRPLGWLLATLALWSCYATVRKSRLVAARAASSARAMNAPRCEQCRARRPPRTHHCSVCRLCTPRMCHHCSVLGVCIGAHNHKAFVLLLLYGAVASLLLLALCGGEAVEKGKELWFGERKLSAGLVLWFQVYLLQYNLGLAVGSYFLFHLYIIALNRTMLEACILNSWRTLLPPWRPSPWPYDKGVLANFTEVFGSPWVALLPIANNSLYTIDEPKQPSFC